MANAISSGSVTVLLTTSPSRSDPDLEMLRITLASLAFAGLASCRRILLCDFFETDETPSDTGRKIGIHNGRLPAKRVAAYRERIALFREAGWAAGTEVPTN
jgi:hypothetical protein